MTNIRVGRIVLSQALGFRASARRVDAGLVGPTHEEEWSFRGREASSTARATALSLLTEAKRRGYVHVEDDDGLVTVGHYRFADAGPVQAEGGAPFRRPWDFDMARRDVPSLLVRECESENTQGADTADVTASEGMKVNYTPSTTARAVVKIGSSLVLAWRLEADGTDFSGSALTGTGVSPAFVAGKIGSCGHFDGSTHYLRTDALDGVFPTNTPSVPFSLEAWANTDTVAGADTLLSAGGDTSGNGVKLKRNGATWEAFVVGGTVHTGGVAAAGTWAHLVLVWDGTSIFLYVDGVLAASGAPGVSFSGFNIDRFTVAANADNSPSDFFDGKIDEVRMYAKALTAAEVLRRYNQVSGGTRPANDHRAPYDEALDVPGGVTWASVVRAQCATATAVLRHKWIGNDGTVLSTGSDKTLTPAGAWVELGLGSFAVPAANDKANTLVVEVRDPTNTNPVQLDVLRVVPV